MEPGGDGEIAQPKDAAEEMTKEAMLFLGISLCLVVLVTGFLLVYMVRKCSVSWLPEAWVFFLIGLLTAGFSAVGGPLASDLDKIIETLNLTFPELFFVALLPPIIFESGFSMDKGPFFRNFGAITVFAFLGTLLSYIVIGLSVWLCGQTGLIYPFSLVDSLLFGSIVSATDPVTVLAVFQQLGVDRDLYALVFGESVLNDAVAIVLFHTTALYETQTVTGGSLVFGLAFFAITFVGSLALGGSVGVASALLFKHVPLHRRQHRGLERVILVVSPFVAYMLAEGLRLSGVVAILFTGITMAHYTMRNVSPDTQRFALRLFKTLASALEALVFVYMGIASRNLFVAPHLPDLAPESAAPASNETTPAAAPGGGEATGAGAAAPAPLHYGVLLLVAVLACLAGRSANVEACTAIVNSARQPVRWIQKPTKFLLWFSGLRGGVAFALAASARVIMLDQQAGLLLQSATLFVVVLSLFSIGGAIAPVLGRMGMLRGGDPEAKEHAAQLRNEHQGQPPSEHAAQASPNGGAPAASCVQLRGRGGECG